MPSKDERAKRRHILRVVREENRRETRDAFPLPQPMLKQLFDYLDERISAAGCDDTLRFTREFTTSNSLPETEIVSWLKENGGHCDCEVIGNVEEIVSEANA